MQYLLGGSLFVGWETYDGHLVCLFVGALIFEMVVLSGTSTAD